jgi:hypothetical protein
VTLWLGQEFALHGGDIDPEQAFQDLDRLRRDHPEYFDSDGPGGPPC